MGDLTVTKDETGPRVLVADDEEGLRSLLTIRFEQQDLAVVTAADGMEARDRLEDDGAFDAVILDLGMPRMDGYELLEWMRSQNHPPLTIVLSGHDSDADRQRALDLGADDYIVKPFSPAELATTVRDRIDGDG